MHYGHLSAAAVVSSRTHPCLCPRARARSESEPRTRTLAGSVSRWTRITGETRGVSPSPPPQTRRACPCWLRRRRPRRSGTRVRARLRHRCLRLAHTSGCPRARFGSRARVPVHLIAHVQHGGRVGDGGARTFCSGKMKSGPVRGVSDVLRRYGMQRERVYAWIARIVHDHCACVTETLWSGRRTGGAWREKCAVLRAAARF
jgi:hypothetical protein